MIDTSDMLAARARWKVVLGTVRRPVVFAQRYGFDATVLPQGLGATGSADKAVLNNIAVGQK
jgi:hypothetical protein